MELSCPKAAKNGAFLEDGYKNFVKNSRTPGITKIGYMWLPPKKAEKPANEKSRQTEEKRA